MIQKLRIKVIGVIMAMAIVLLIVVFAGMYVATEQNYRRRSEETIRTALMAEIPDKIENDAILGDNNGNSLNNERMDKIPDKPEIDGSLKESDHAEQPVLVVKKEADGTIRLIRNTTIYQDTAEYEKFIEAAQEKESDRGELKEERLRYQYRKDENNGTACYVFADMYEEIQTLSEQVIHSLCIGVVAIFFFFMAALWFSGWAIRPIEEAWKREQQFIADASHELKTPLTVILANTEMIQRDMNKICIERKERCKEKIEKDIKEISEYNYEAEENEKEKSNLEKNLERMTFIKEEAQRMKKLTESLLSLARSDAGIVALVKTDVSLSEIAEFQTASFETVLFETGKMLQADIEENVKVKGDEKKLRQLFEILLDNAGKYGLPGSEIVLSLKRNGEKGASICVENEADKLTEEMCSHLFDRFYRTDASRSNVPGYGLGLSIAQSIVQEHGGTISAVYENGRMKMKVEI